MFNVVTEIIKIGLLMLIMFILAYIADNMGWIMTNIEKIKEIFPNINIYEHGSTYSINNEYNFNASWCNAEYIEPNTKNNLAQERYQDLIEYFGGEDTVLKDRKEFKAWLERVKWHVKRADELAIELEQIKGNTKNDLAVDCIDRQATLDAIIKRLGIKNETYLIATERAIYQQILAMPSVTPQLSSGLEKNSKKLEKDFGELDCISREQALEPYKILENTDTLSVYTIRQNLAELPSMGRYDPYTDKFIKE